MAFRKKEFGFKRRTYKIICSKCKNPEEVPFKPREGTRVLCRNCFLEEKGISKKPEKKEASEQELEENTEEIGETEDEESEEDFDK